MPTPEHPLRHDSDDHEREPLPYHRAARFRLPYPAGVAYDKAQRLIYRSDDSDLSAFRFHVDRVWYVAIAGEEPPAPVHRKIEKVLTAGQPVRLAPQILAFLQERRAEAIKQGPWVERHHRSR